MLSKSASARREKRNLATTLPRLARRSGKLQGLTDTPKYVTLGDTAGVAFVDSRSQRGKLRFVLLFLALQSPQSGAHDLTGVFVASSLNLLGDEAVKFVGQIDIPGRHDDWPFCRYEFRNQGTMTGKVCKWLLAGEAFSERFKSRDSVLLLSTEEKEEQD